MLLDQRTGKQKRIIYYIKKTISITNKNNKYISFKTFQIKFLIKYLSNFINYNNKTYQTYTSVKRQLTKKDNKLII